MTAWSRALAAGGVAATVLTATTAHAQPPSWPGEWRGQAAVGMGAVMVVDLVIQPSGTYSETEKTGQIMTMQTGVVKLPAAGEIAFVVQNWQPRTMPVYHAVGTQGGYYTQQPTTQPPGGVWRYQFNGSNSVTLQDLNMGGSITMTRVR